MQKIQIVIVWIGLLCAPGVCQTAAQEIPKVPQAPQALRVYPTPPPQLGLPPSQTTAPKVTPSSPSALSGGGSAPTPRLGECHSGICPESSNAATDHSDVWGLADHH